MIYIVYLLISTLIFVFQSTLCEYIKIAGVKPNIMLIFVVSAAFLKGSGSGLLIGIIMGLLHDCYFGQTIGSNLFLYGAIGFIVGCLTDNFNKDNIVAPVIFTFVATLVYNFGVYLFNIILKGYTSFNIYIVWNVLPELIYNTILAFAVYFVLYSINNYSVSGRIRRKHRF